VGVSQFKLPLFVMMKVAAFFLMICITFVSVLPGKGQALVTQEKMDCCKKTGKELPCDHKKKQDCKHGMCLTRMCCNVIGFTPVEPMNVSKVLPVTRSTSLTPFSDGSPSGYSALTFQPPEV
jgi:hypothetical protein